MKRLWPPGAERDGEGQEVGSGLLDCKKDDLTYQFLVSAKDKYVAWGGIRRDPRIIKHVYGPRAPNAKPTLEFLRNGLYYWVFGGNLNNVLLFLHFSIKASSAQQFLPNRNAI